MSTMKNHLRSFLSRLALSGLAVPLILLSPALVRADAITRFVVSGTALNINPLSMGSCAFGATCGFSGSFQVDTTNGTVESSDFNILFPGLPAFNLFMGSGPFEGAWEIEAFNGDPTSSEDMILSFTPAPTPNSLVGLTGGTIIGLLVTSTSPDFDSYAIQGGSITPAPEPSSLVLFTSGMLVFGLTRRFGKKVGHPFSA